MSDTSYEVELRPCSPNGYFTPEQSNNYYATKYARDGIVVHWWGDGTGADNHDNIVNYIISQSEQAIKSVNYVLSDNKITLCVSPDNVAWATQGANPTTISVETQPTLGAEGYKKWGWLVDQLEQRYGKNLRLHRHSEYFATQCPGSIDPDRIRAEANLWKSGAYDAPVAVSPPAPVVVAPEPVAVVKGDPTPPLYTVANISNKLVKVTSGKSKWNLNQPTLADITANPITEADDNTIFTAVAVLHYTRTNSQYYLEDANTPHGWNIVDCTDYTLPLIPPVPPTPIALPNGAYNVGNSEQYVVIKQIDGYSTSNRAINHDSPNQPVGEGDYYIFNRRFSDTDPTKLLAINVTTKSGVPGAWINPLDNVPDPIVVPEKPVLVPSNWGGNTRTDTSTPVPVAVAVVTPPLPTEPLHVEAPTSPALQVPPTVNTNAWKLTNSPLQLDRQVQWFESRNNQIIQIHDLDQKGSAVPLQPYTPVPLISVFEKDGIRYGRTQKVAKAGLWYGVPMSILVPENDIFGTAKTIAERAFTHSLKLSDGPAIMLGKLERFLDGIKQTRRK